MRLGGRGFAALAVLSIVAGCTFGDLAGYEVGTCNAGHQTQKEDECDSLNGGDTVGCMPFQCDATTQHCVTKARDDDRDGDPSSACGGSDCDDHDPANFGGTRAKEKCDGRDNNCNGVVDEDISYIGAQAVAIPNPGSGMGEDPFIAGDSGTHMVGGYVAQSGTGTCIQVLGLTNDAGAVGALAPSSACYFLTSPDESHLGPRQPIARVLTQNGAPEGAAVAFVATGPDASCGASESLEYRWAAADQAPSSSSLDCASRSDGVALPSLAQFPSGEVAVLWYATPFGSRADAVGNCANAQAAKLMASVIATPTSAPATLPKATAIDASGVSLRPAATALVPGFAGLLVAAPSGGDVAIHSLDAKGNVGTVVSSIPSLAGARGVSIAVGSLKGSVADVALIAEIGCAPQAIVAALGTFDVSSGAAAFPTTVPVSAASAAGLQVTPAAVWLQKAAFESGDRTEWNFTWTLTDSEPHLYARRFDAAGQPLSPAFSFADGIALGAPAVDGTVLTVDRSYVGFASVAPRCP